MKELVEQLDEALTQGYEDYKKLHAEFDTYRGRMLDGNDHIEVNRLLTEIQLKFKELYGVYHFIGARHQFAVEQVNKYNDFTDSLKKSGAQEESAGKA